MRGMTAPRGSAGAMTTRDGVNAVRETRIATAMECKVCWYVYDPAAGDPVWQIPPGTPWPELPPHWTCPQCSSTRDGFLQVSDD